MKHYGITIESKCTYCGCAASVTKLTLRLFFNLLRKGFEILPSPELCNDCIAEGVE
jgi:hypothetical protein